MKIRIILIGLFLVGTPFPDSFAHDGSHTVRPSPFRECRYVTEPVGESTGANNHIHRTSRTEKCWITNETYVVIGLAVALVIVVALSYNDRYQIVDERPNSPYSFEPTLNLQKKELGIRMAMNW